MHNQEPEARMGLERAEAWGFTLAGNDDFKVTCRLACVCVCVL
jgi:hypothetical protein